MRDVNVVLISTVSVLLSPLDTEKPRNVPLV